VSLSVSLPRLLLTGAAGGLGRQLRGSLKPFCSTLRVSDIADLGEAQMGEETMLCDLADKAAVDRLLKEEVAPRI
jgi:uronate dehydrogenase